MSKELQKKLQTADELAAFMSRKTQYISDALEIIAWLGLMKLKVGKGEITKQEIEIEIDKLLKKYSHILKTIKKRKE